MEDYTSLFGDQRFGESSGLTPATPTTTTPATGGMDWSKLLTNPALQAGVLNFAAALDPNGFGGRLAKGAMEMLRGGERAKVGSAVTNAPQASGLPQIPGQQTAIPPAVPPTQQPAILSDQHVNASENPLETAKQYNEMGSLLKKAFSIRPDLVPAGFQSEFGKALAANPQIANPTQPIGSTNAGPPVGATTTPVARPFSIDTASGMALGPEQVGAAFDFYKGMVDTTSDASYRNWLMQPQRHAEALALAGEPSRAAAEMYKQKAQFDIQSANDFISQNPRTAAIKLPGGMSLGEMVRLSAANGAAGTVVGQLINAGLDFQAAKYATDMHLAGVKLTAETQGKSDEFHKDLNAFAEFNKQASTKLMSVEEWNKKTPQERQLSEALGIYPRTPEAEESIRTAKQMRDILGVKLYGPSYGQLVNAAQKVENATQAPQVEVADPNKLKEVQKGFGPKKGLGSTDYNRKTAFGQDSPADAILRMFSPKEAGAAEFDPRLVGAVIKAESGGNAKAISNKGAKGMMQLMPSTAKEMGVRDIFNPTENIKGGTRYLAKLMSKYRGDLVKVLAAYNWGQGNVDRHGLDKMPLETRNFISRVLSNYVRGM